MSVFRKRNPNNTDALLHEAEGLRLLDNALQKHHIHQLSTPAIIEASHNQLCLAHINSITPSTKHFQNLAIGLAKLHTIKQGKYGFEKDNYIGMAVQCNELSDNWGRFFIEFRLLPQIKMIKDKAIHDHFLATLQRSAPRVIELLNATCSHASLLHGDLWSGNVMFGNESRVYLIDPATYFGDSEADIAMTEMFGGFSEVFYQTYNLQRPLHKEYPVKRQIYNLYHYLNHYNLFGSSYLGSCQRHLAAINRL